MSTMTMQEAAQSFLSNKRIAVAGVSREADGAHSGNAVYNRLKETGFEVFAVNPAADELEGDKSYRSLAEIPGGAEAVVIATHPDAAPAVMRDCVDLGVKHVWMHRAFGRGSFSSEAVSIGREGGVTVIPGGCPLMFEPCRDGAHKFLKTVLGWTGAVPRKVQAS